MSTGQVIRNYRERLGDTRKAFSARMTAEIGREVTANQIIAWEFDRTTPSIWMVQYLADVCPAPWNKLGADLRAAIDLDVERRR